MEPGSVPGLRRWAPEPAGGVGDLEPTTIQAWMDSMATADLALGAMRVRQSTLSSLCSFLVKRGHLDTNPVARLDRPPHRREAPRQVPGSSIMDALVKAARQRQRPRDLAIFLILRYSGMRRESVATLRVRNLDRRWGLRNVPVKGGNTRDIPLPVAVMEHLDGYATQYLPTEVDDIKPDTPLFWSTFGQRRQGLVGRPMEGKNVWRLCKTYGRLIGYPMLKPHDLRHGVAMEVYEQHGDLEQLRGLLGHARLETTQLYAQIRPAAVTQAVEFYEAKALDVLSS
jgi:integrase/recombinase XerC